MNQMSRDRLYQLLPAIYQLKDAAEGEPLQALLAVIEQEVQTIEDDIGDLYNNWFIETCDDWVIPYIGDLLDVRELYVSMFPANQSQNQGSPEKVLSEPRSPRTSPYGQQERRAYIANTLAYRRRKGTTPVLEQLVRDVTGWRARAVEFSHLLLTTQNLNHLRPISATVDLRNTTPLELIGTPFDQQAAYTTELRRVSQGGRYATPTIGLFVWRLQSYPLERSTARRMVGLEADLTRRCYTISPLGDDMPLFNQPQTVTDITLQAQEINLPAPLRCSSLAKELQQRRQLRLKGNPLPVPRYFNESSPVLQIFVNGQPNPISPEEMLVCSLTPTMEAQTSMGDQPWLFPQTDGSALPTQVVAVDPELGRLVFLDRTLPERVEASYLYGFSDDLGGGPYSRDLSSADSVNLTVQKQMEAPPEAPLINPLFWEVEQVTSAAENPLETAIQAWNTTVSAWQDLRDQIHIPLARIIVPPIQISQIRPKPDQARSRFRAGIVEGLELLPGCCASEVLITPGLAIDRQGRRLQLSTIETIDFREYALSEGLLILGYRATLVGSQYQLDFVPETAIGDEGYPEGTFIPLAKVTRSKQQPQLDRTVRRSFQQGIIQGLNVKVRPGTFQAVITPGMAADSRGHIFVATRAKPLNLQSYQGTVGALVLQKLSSGEQQWQVSYLTTTEDVQPDLCLAQLDIPCLKVTVDCTSRLVHGLEVSLAADYSTIVWVSAGEARACNNQLIRLDATTSLDVSSSHWLTQYQGERCSLVLCTGVDNAKGGRGTIRIVELEEAFADFENYILLANLVVSDGQSNQPPITIYPAARVVEDLEVSAVNQFITVAKGIARNTQGQEIRLKSETPYQFDLSAYAAQRFVLFVAQRRGQGFPLELVSSANGQDWQQLGIVPQEPERSDTGMILIKDNLTYEGDLAIVIPQGKRLQIAAADGYRPHLCGHVRVQGTAPYHLPNQGELMLNGLLIEGQLTVLPGNLKRLQVMHSTLVPQCGGLQVQPQAESPPCIFDIEDPFVPVTLAITALTFLQGFVKSNPGRDQFPEKYLGQLTQLVIQQVARLIADIWKILYPWVDHVRSSLDTQDADWTCLFGAAPPEAGGDPQDNSRLEISLYQSICGPLDLTETILSLNLEGCILDHGLTSDSMAESGGWAISAVGTDSVIVATTVLGMTAVRRLEASNSLFTQKVTVRQHQTGCLRFSYVPEGSQTPPRYQCQPDVAFKAALNPIPDAITSLAVNHPTDTQIRLFASTAGGGVFRFSDQDRLWQAVNQGLTNRYVSVVLVYPQPGIGTVTPTGTTVAGASTVFTQQCRPQDQITIAGQTRTINEIVNDGALVVDREFVNLNSPPYSFQISCIFAGTTGGKLFRSQNEGARWTALAGTRATATITALCQYIWPFTGTVSEDGRQIEVDPAFSIMAFQLGDTLTIDDQTRQIINVSVRQSLQSNAKATVLTLSAPLTNPSGQTFQVSTLLVATAGEGIWRANANGENWISITTDLINSDIRALAVDTQGRIVVGTAGDGAFQQLHEESGDRWAPLNPNGLTNYYITTLAMGSNGIIMAGTAGGGIFCFNADEDEWVAVNQGLPSLDISTFVASDDRWVVATTDGKIFHSQDQGGYWVQRLDLNGLDVTALALDASNHPFAGTAAGNILQFEETSGRWLSLNAGLTNVIEKLLIMDQLQPTFTSTHYGHPGYAQLSQNCAHELRTGADDGAEMGVFNRLKQPQRAANLQANLEEYLRFGLEAGIFYIT